MFQNLNFILFYFLGNFAYYGHCVKMFDNDLKQLDNAFERIHYDEDQLYRDGLIEMPKFLVSSMIDLML